MKISEADKKILKTKNISEELLEKQLKRFRDGFEPLNIVEAATCEKGINKYGEDEMTDYISFYEKNSKDYELLKFIPSSGAATRMFKKLFEFRNNYKGEADEYREFVSDTSDSSVYSFFSNINKFPFFDELETLCYDKIDMSVDDMIEKHQYLELLDLILMPEGLNLGFKPKALIKFHRYEEKTRTPIAEHLVSAVHLLEGQQKYNIHFTVTRESLADFKKEADYYANVLKEKHGITLVTTYSFQESSTDTVAATIDNEFFRKENGELLFRPGGHGALIHNLNNMTQDVIFLKNIDNVVPDWNKDKNIPYEKLLGGVLLSYQQKIFSYIEKLEKGASSKLQKEIKAFINDELCYDFVGGTEQQLINILNRPLRVCGMVVNEGEPGGGPFYVKNNDGTSGLQIVESSQINLEDEHQKHIFEKSTHFNPVDIVCGVKNYKGEKFDLLKFVDEEAGFISNKSLNGRKLKALELPGLWNGAMTFWNTIFVEVPDFTFNPVKTIADLLRPQHSN